MLNTHTLEATRQQIIEEYGPWVAHDIKVAPDVYTLGLCSGDPRGGYIFVLKSLLQNASDLIGKPLNQLRVLDLACMEGQYGLEFAMHGAQVVAIEGRHANLVKSRFAQEALKLDNIEFIQDDVRNLSREKYGTFDVVLCAGILYHLTAPDVFEFLEKVYEVTGKITLLDTHFALAEHETVKYKGKPYPGVFTREHQPETSAEEREENVRASLDNDTAYWLTKRSLLTFIKRLGYTSVFEVAIPDIPYGDDRSAFALIKGEEQLPVKTSPQLKAALESPREMMVRGGITEMYAYVLANTDKTFSDEFTACYAGFIRKFSQERGIVPPKWVTGPQAAALPRLEAEHRLLIHQSTTNHAYTKRLEHEWEVKNQEIAELKNQIAAQQQALNGLPVRGVRQLTQLVDQLAKGIQKR